MTTVAPPPDRSVTLAAVRRRVRTMLEGMPGYHQASHEMRNRTARNLVDVAMAGADLLATEAEQDDQLHGRAMEVPAGFSQAQSIGDTARDGADAMERLRNAVDFPTFVQSLITGVFNAISNANVHQFERLGNLLEAVSRSTPDLASNDITDAAAAQWAAAQFAGLRVGDGGTLELADDVDFEPIRTALRGALGASSSEIDGVSEDELGETLIPLVKRKLARDRRRVLASMIQMGLQRIVVDEGRIHASMDLRVDTSALRERQRDNRTDFRLNASASAQAGGVGWGANASMDTTVGYVMSDSQYSRDDLQTQAGLRSSVDLAFRTEQVPLDRVATPSQRATIAATAPTPVTVGPPATPPTRRLTRATFDPVPDPGTGQPRAQAGTPNAAGTTPPAGGGPDTTPPAGGNPS